MVFKEVPRAVKLDALILAAKGIRLADVAAAKEISESTIKRAKAKVREHGTLDVPHKKPGPNPTMGPGIQAVCCTFPSG